MNHYFNCFKVSISLTEFNYFCSFQFLTHFLPTLSLGFSVTLFCAEALFAIIILLLRRNPAVGGELGGPKSVKTVTTSIFVCFWLNYVLVSAMVAYGVIDPGL